MAFTTTLTSILRHTKIFIEFADVLKPIATHHIEAWRFVYLLPFTFRLNFYQMVVYRSPLSVSQSSPSILPPSPQWSIRTDSEVALIFIYILFHPTNQCLPLANIHPSSYSSSSSPPRTPHEFVRQVRLPMRLLKFPHRVEVKHLSLCLSVTWDLTHNPELDHFYKYPPSSEREEGVSVDCSVGTSSQKENLECRSRRRSPGVYDSDERIAVLPATRFSLFLLGNLKDNRHLFLQRGSRWTQKTRDFRIHILFHVRRENVQLTRNILE